jgi:hypothetical protein
LLSFPKKELQFLFDGFIYGFKIPFQEQRKYRIHENLISAKQNMKTLTDKITTEVLAGRVAGHFQTPPFTNIQISPLGLVPKKCPGEFRIIHHLSYPEGSFINDGFFVDLEKQQAHCSRYRRLNCSSLPNSVCLFSDSQKSLIQLTHPFSHFYVVFI